MNQITKRQNDVLCFVSDFCVEQGFPPTRKEIADNFGFSSANAAQDHLNALQLKGFIKLFPGASRGIKVL